MKQSSKRFLWTLPTYTSWHFTPVHITTILAMTIMYKGLDDVSELRPLRGLLFIPQVIYEHG
jgi:hypothetical protein